MLARTRHRHEPHRRADRRPATGGRRRCLLPRAVCAHGLGRVRTGRSGGPCLRCRRPLRLLRGRVRMDARPVAARRRRGPSRSGRRGAHHASSGRDGACRAPAVDDPGPRRSGAHPGRRVRRRGPGLPRDAARRGRDDRRRRSRRGPEVHARRPGWCTGDAGTGRRGGRRKCVHCSSVRRAAGTAAAGGAAAPSGTGGRDRGTRTGAGAAPGHRPSQCGGAGRGGAGGRGVSRGGRLGGRHRAERTACRVGIAGDASGGRRRVAPDGGRDRRPRRPPRGACPCAGGRGGQRRDGRPGGRREPEHGVEHRTVSASAPRGTGRTGSDSRVRATGAAR